MGQIDITDFVTGLINSITDEKIINKVDKTYVDDNFVLKTLFEEQINLKSDTNHNHDDRYYTESEMDIKLSEIESSIVGGSGFSVSIVDTLPDTGEFNTIYLVLSESPIENNKYNNFIWTGTEYDELGSPFVDIDLSNYATLDYITSELSKYATIATLNTELSKKANNDHTHDTRYYTESEVDDLFTQLNGVLETKSDVGHTHIIGDVSNLQSTLDNKAPSSHVHSRLVPTSIPANADLNDYTTQGSFYCSMNADAQTLKNCPVTEAFHLECYKHNGVRQVLQTFFDTSVHTFERNYYAGGNRWSEWYKIINQSSVDSSLSTSSTNPVQNKVVNTALANKSNTTHTHTTLVKSADIPSNADLNDYTTTGFYLCSYTNTTTLINKPDSIVTGGIRLEVLSQSNGVTQIIMAYSKTSVENKMYFRYYYQSEDIWTSWQKVITTLNVDSSLSTSSTNPVQNKAIYSAIGDIKTALNNILGV